MRSTLLVIFQTLRFRTKSKKNRRKIHHNEEEENEKYDCKFLFLFFSDLLNKYGTALVPTFHLM